MSSTLSRQYIHVILELCSEGRLDKVNAAQTIVRSIQKTAIVGDVSRGKDLIIKNRSYLYRNAFIDTNSQGTYILTPKGRKLLRKYRLGLPLKAEEWDGKWRVVLYDIPETHRSGRIALLKTLKSLGFWQLRRSVWICPYDCDKRIRYIASSYDLQPNITYMEVSYIDQEARLLSHFGLMKRPGY